MRHDAPVLDLVALAWVASSLAGTVIAGWGVMNGIADLQAVKGITNGRRIFARDYLRSQALRLIVCATWLLIGIPIALDGRETPLNGVTAVLVGTNALLALAAALSMRSRLLLLRSR